MKYNVGDDLRCNLTFISNSSLHLGESIFIEGNYYKLKNIVNDTEGLMLYCISNELNSNIFYFREDFVNEHFEYVNDNFDYAMGVL